MSDSIHCIITGGTIDSFYDATKDTVTPLPHSVLPKFVKNLKLYQKVKFTEICMKDSRDLTLQDRKQILKTIELSSSKKLLITQGTYTLTETAQYLQKNIKTKNKTVILTGAMSPLDGFVGSDGLFNLGFALAKLEDLDPGVYVCMNGKVFAPEEVKKVRDQGRFVSVLGEK